MIDLTFTVELTREAHQKAEIATQRQLTQSRGKQAYLNALSAYAVDFYLRCMGFETNTAQCDREDPIVSTFLDVADIEVKQVGRLECCPVLPGDRTMRIPQELLQQPKEREVWSKRVGYIAVQLDAELKEAKQAKLLGFVKQATTEEIDLERLQSLDTLLQYASTLESSVKLSHWLDRIFESSWQTIEAVFSPPQMAFRGMPSRLQLGNERANPDLDAIERIKVLNLPGLDTPLALLVRLLPHERPKMNIGVEVYPTGDLTHLPTDLKLAILDEEGDAVMQAEARTTKNIQFKFSGEAGEQFSVKVALGNTHLTESFLI
jgi:Protein of unknown function (DUF1822)